MGRISPWKRTRNLFRRKWGCSEIEVLSSYHASGEAGRRPPLSRAAHEPSPEGGESPRPFHARPQVFLGGSRARREPSRPLRPFPPGSDEVSSTPAEASWVSGPNSRELPENSKLTQADSRVLHQGSRASPGFSAAPWPSGRDPDESWPNAGEGVAQAHEVPGEGHEPGAVAPALSGEGRGAALESRDAQGDPPEGPRLAAKGRADPPEAPRKTHEKPGETPEAWAKRDEPEGRQDELSRACRETATIGVLSRRPALAVRSEGRLRGISRKTGPQSAETARRFGTGARF